MERPSKDIVEIFGYASDDLSDVSRSLWGMGACPFIGKECTKKNNDKTITYGTCTVTSPYGDCIVCPNRLYENGYSSLRKVAGDVFHRDIEFLTYEEYIPRRNKVPECVVALGKNSGKEVRLGTGLSMDWVLVRVVNGRLAEYVGVEVQSIDTTGNYRDTWLAYKNMDRQTDSIPGSKHGLNWANVWKRLIPQLIQKGKIYSGSNFVNAGLYFIVPDIVYSKFEEVLGADIPVLKTSSSSTLTVHTYSLSDPVEHGCQRHLVLVREIKFEWREFTERFTRGDYLPESNVMDDAVRKALGLI